MRPASAGSVVDVLSHMQKMHSKWGCLCVFGIAGGISVRLCTICTANGDVCAFMHSKWGCLCVYAPPYSILLGPY